MLKKTLKALLTAICIIAPLASVNAQDLIAAQAPVDKQMAMVDSIALRNMLLNEAFNFPADELYPTWKNSGIHYTSEMPDSFRFDLREFVMPTTNTKITDIFGYRPRRRRVHNGLDVKVEKGDTIYAAFSGKVRIAAFQRRGYGHYLVVRHNNGLETVYAHLSKRLVTEDQIVKAGEPIGLGGNTGRSTGSHLHFETVFMGKPLDPALFFNFPKQDVTGDYYVWHQKGKRKVDSKGKVTYEAEPKYHKVRSGESLSVIARKHGVSVNTLYRLNKLTSRSVLRIGQTIRYQ